MSEVSKPAGSAAAGSVAEDGPQESRIPPPFIHTVNIMTGAALHFLVYPLPIKVVYYIRRPIGLVIVIGGFFITGICARLYKAHGERFSADERPKTLITEGILGRTRNPLYIAVALVHFGFALIVGTWWIFLTLPIAILMMYRVIIRPEEAALRARFGEAYEAYCQKTPRWL